MNTTQKALIAGVALVGITISGIGLWDWIKNKGIQNKIVKGEKNAEGESRPATTTDVQRISKWEILYSDALLGQVTGTATVNWEKNFARVVLRDPRTHTERPPLVSHNLQIQGKNSERVTMTLEGESPSADPAKPPQTAGLRRLSTNEDDQIKADPADPEFSAPVKAKADADVNRVRIEFSRDAFGSLFGSWSYFADPLTERDRIGKGRVGNFRLMSNHEIEEYNEAHKKAVEQLSGGFIGIQSGHEEWWPLPISIIDVEVLEDQLAFNDGLPVYRYPFANAYAFGPPREEEKYRTLFVVGNNFPLLSAEWIGPEPGSAYRIIAVSTDPNLSAEIKKKFELGRLKFFEKLKKPAEKTQQEIREMDAVLLRVSLAKEDLAGPKKFFLGDASSSWWLQFGDNNAETRFLRVVNQATSSDPNSVTTYEPVPTAYLPEDIKVEVRTRIDLPLEQIPITIGRESLPEEWQTVQAQRVSPTLYRTDLIPIIQEGGLRPSTARVIQAIIARDGDVVNASINERDLLQKQNFQFKETQLAKIPISRTPSLKKREKKANEPEPRQPISLWKEALLRAAYIAGKQGMDLSALPGQPAKTLDFAQSPGEAMSGKARIEIKIRDHAAMLILRDQFLELLGAHRDWLNNIKDDEESLEAFRAWIAPYVFYRSDELMEPLWVNGTVKYPSWLSFAVGDSNLDEAMACLEGMNRLKTAVPRLIYNKAKEALFGPESGVNAFGKIGVTGPAGGTWQFHTTFGEFGQYEKFFGNKWEGWRKWKQWRQSTAKEALDYYRKTVNESYTYVDSIKDDDYNGLLKLTGVSFAAVVQKAIPRMMKLEDTGTPPVQRWVVDKPARYAIMHLHTTANAVVGLENYASVRKQWNEIPIDVILMAENLGIGIIPSEGMVAAIAKMSGRLWLWKGLVSSSLIEPLKARADVRFELANAPVLGMERLTEAEEKQPDWFYNLLSQAAPVVAGKLWDEFGAMDKVPQWYRGMFSLRGEQLAPTVLQKGVSGFTGLSPAEQLSLLTFLKDVSSRIRIGAAVSLSQMKAFYKAKLMAEDLPPKPLPVVPALKPIPLPVVEPEPPAVPPPPAAAGPKPPGVETLTLPAEPRAPAGHTTPEEPKLPPIAPGSWTSPGKGADGRYVMLRVGDLLSSEKGGASAIVYRLKSVMEKGNEKDATAEYGKKVVIKFLKDNLEQMGSAREQALRIQETYERLKKTAGGAHPVGFAEILEIHPEAARPYLIQEEIENDGAKRILLNAKAFYDADNKRFIPYEEIEKSGKFPRHLQVAVARLHLAIGLNDFSAPDLSLPNLYFEKVGGIWVAKILDIDHVIGFREKSVHGSVTREFLNNIFAEPYDDFWGINSIVKGQGKIPDAVTCMRKFMELKTAGNLRHGYVKYNPKTGELESGLMDASVIPEVFKDLGKQIPPPPPQKPKQGSWLFPFPIPLSDHALQVPLVAAA